MKKYKSRIGIELILILTLTFGFIGFQIFSEEFSLLALILFSIPIIGIYFYLKIITYIIKDEILLIKAGFLVNEKIQINNIRKIEELINVISAPAASIKRLEIVYNKYDSIMISPKNQEQFIKDLLEINNNIQVNLK